MQDTRSIVIIGTKGVGKSTLFWQLTKKYSTDFRKKKPTPIVNYTEELIIIENNVYRLIDTPAFVLSPQSEIEKGIRKQIDQLLEKCGLICWIVDLIEEKTLLLNKYLKKKPSPRILLLNKTDLENNEENISTLRILQPSNYFLISALKGTNLDRLAKEIINLLSNPSLLQKSEKEKKNKFTDFWSS